MSPQSYIKKRMGSMQFSSALGHKSLTQKIFRSKVKINKLSKKTEVMLHPLQREQNLNKLVIERDKK
jgi:hypothetical protein